MFITTSVFNKKRNKCINNDRPKSRYTDLSLEKKLMLFHTGIFRNAEFVTKSYVKNFKNKVSYLQNINSLTNEAINIITVLFKLFILEIETNTKLVGFFEDAIIYIGIINFKLTPFKSTTQTHTRGIME